jgi:hypothetical protein
MISDLQQTYRGLVTGVARCLYISLASSTHMTACGLVVRVLGYRSGGSGSIPGTTRKKSNGFGTGSTQPREYNCGVT